MPDGSIKAGFDFVSYKIDKIEVSLEPKIKFLLNNSYVRPENAKMGFKFKDVEKFDINGKIHYIGGIIVTVTIIDEKSNETILSGEFGISGAFVPKGIMDKSAEENFARVNIPALLMPYLRAEITSTLANAGFGTILFPLLNIYEMAKNTKIKLIDRTDPSQTDEK
jgi:preprotein translocase subunit SecB